jgi:hypothetical protein
LVVKRRGGAGKVIDFIDFDVERKADVMAKKLEMGIGQQMGDVVAAPRVAIIDAKHFMARIKKPFAKMGA